MQFISTNNTTADKQVRSRAKAALEYRIYGSFSEARGLKDAWNHLAERTGDLFCSFDWCDVWWQHFGASRQLEIHTLHDESRLVAVLPLFRETLHPGGLWLRMVRPAGYDHTVSTAGLAIEPKYADTFTQMLLNALDKRGVWDILEIASLRSYACVSDAIARACVQDERIQTTVIGREDAWNTLFELPDNYETFLASLSGNARNDTRRRERQLNQRHKVEVQAVTRPEEVPAAMETLIHLHQKRWTEQGQPGQLREESVQQFHCQLARRMVQQGQLVLLILKVDGEPLAATYGYHFGERVHGLFRGQSTDPQWEDFSLGRLMHCQLIRHTVERGCSVLEDGRGVFDYKIRLGGRLYGERSVLAVRRGWSTRLRFWASLRAAYLVHVLYSRIWGDMIAKRLGLRTCSRRFYIRNVPLRQMFWHVPLRLFSRDRIVLRQCSQQSPVPRSQAESAIVLLPEAAGRQSQARVQHH